MQKFDIDKLELVADGINDAVDVAEAVFADGKVDLKDIDQIDDLGEALGKLYQGLKDLREVRDEALDIDPAEAVVLLQKLLAKK